MKWKTQQRAARRARAPRVGDERCRRMFAWRPVEAKDGHTYWLCHVVVYEAYKRVFLFDAVFGELGEAYRWEPYNYAPARTVGKYVCWT